MTGDAAKKAVLSDPSWFFEDFDPNTRILYFVRTDRDTLSREPFLGDGRWDHSKLPKTEMTVNDALGLLGHNLSPSPVNTLWHTSFCCSTLIAQALDHPGLSLALKEPAALLNLVQIKRAGLIGPGARFPVRFADLVFNLLGRKFTARETILIKPTNVCNYLLRDAAVLTAGKMLFLYSDCRSFVISIAKKKEYGRRYVRAVFSRIVADGNEQVRWPIPTLFAMSDLQVAAVAWHMQIAEFMRNIPTLASGRFASLDCDAFNRDPIAGLSKLDSFFGLGIGEINFSKLLAGPLFRQHAKVASQQFNLDDRVSQHQDVAGQLGADLDEVVRWSYEVCRTTPRGTPLPNSLMEIDKDYIPKLHI